MPRLELLQNFVVRGLPRTETEQAVSKSEIHTVLTVSDAIQADRNGTVVSRAFPDEGAARRALQVMEARRSGRETDLLHRICHELLSAAELPIVLKAVLDHLASHLGSDIGYLRVVDQEQPQAVIESVRGLTGRELDSVRAWIQQGPRELPVRSLAAARQERPEDTLARYPINDQPSIEGVLVLDRRDGTGPSAVEEHRVIVAVTSLIADAIRYRRDLSQPRPATLAPGEDEAPSGDAPAWGRNDESVAPRPAGRRSLKSLLFAFEREILIDALRDAGGNQSRAARALHTTPRILTYRLKRHGLHGVLTKANR